MLGILGWILLGFVAGFIAKTLDTRLSNRHHSSRHHGRRRRRVHQDGAAFTPEAELTMADLRRPRDSSAGDRSHRGVRKDANGVNEMFTPAWIRRGLEDPRAQRPDR